MDFEKKARIIAEYYFGEKDEIEQVTGDLVGFARRAFIAGQEDMGERAALLFEGNVADMEARGIKIIATELLFHPQSAKAIRSLPLHDLPKNGKEG